MLHRRYFYPEDHGKDAKHKRCTALPLLPQWQSTDLFFSKVIFHLRLNWSLSLTTAFCETKCSLSKLNLKAESIIQKAFRKKLDMHVIIEVQQKKLPFTESADKYKKYLYRLKLQRTWSLFELTISQIFANKIFPKERLRWWNERCVNIMGAIKQIQWSALIRISSSIPY